MEKNLKNALLIGCFASLLALLLSIMEWDFFALPFFMLWAFLFFSILSYVLLSIKTNKENFSRKVYLAVPYEEKNYAKSLGAKWDPVVKRWFAPNGEEHLTKLWPFGATPLHELINEERSLNNYLLEVDLIPKSCWFTNIQSLINSSDWIKTQNYVFERAKFQCEICGNKQSLYVDGHWHYDELSITRKLICLITLCQDCYEVVHFGLAQIRNKEEKAIQHLMKIRNFSLEEAQLHIKEAFDLWHYRNQFDWKIDFKIISDSGIQVQDHKVKKDFCTICEEDEEEFSSGLKVTPIEDVDEYLKKLFSS